MVELLFHSLLFLAMDNQPQGKRENLKQYSVLPKLKQLQQQIDQLNGQVTVLANQVDRLNKRVYFWQRWLK